MIKWEIVKWVNRFIFIGIIFLLSYLIFKIFIEGLFSDVKLISESISLIIALISLSIAYAVFLISFENKRPIISLELDFNSRYHIVQLNITNSGEKGARNIKFEFSNDSIWLKRDNSLKSIVSFISILSSNQCLKKTIGVQHSVDINSKTTVFISYTDSSGFLRYSDKILIDLSDYKNSASYEDELTKALYSIQQIPEVLQKIVNKRLD